MPFFEDSYGIRPLCVAYDVTGKKEYLDACTHWADQIVAFQDRMTPKAAYYIGYERLPGAKTGIWTVADSGSIGMGVLATAIRTTDPAKKVAVPQLDPVIRPAGDRQLCTPRRRNQRRNLSELGQRDVVRGGDLWLADVPCLRRDQGPRVSEGRPGRLGLDEPSRHPQARPGLYVADVFRRSLLHGRVLCRGTEISPAWGPPPKGLGRADRRAGRMAEGQPAAAREPRSAALLETWITWTAPTWRAFPMCS